MIRKITILVACGLMLAGCATAPPYSKLFSGRSKLGNTHVYHAGVPKVRVAVLQTLSGRGFDIQHQQDNTIKAVNEFKKDAHSHTTYHIVADVVLESIGAHRTQVSIVAQQGTIVHQKSHTWFHLLFIPVVPTGTVYQKHQTDSGTITRKRFYHAFFQALSRQLKQGATQQS